MARQIRIGMENLVPKSKHRIKRIITALIVISAIVLTGIFFIGGPKYHRTPLSTADLDAMRLTMVPGNIGLGRYRHEFWDTFIFLYDTGYYTDGETVYWLYALRNGIGANQAKKVKTDDVEGFIQLDQYRASDSYQTFYKGEAIEK